MEKKIMSDDVLVKYLLGEADNKEIADVKQWLDTDPANQKYFDHLKLIWDQSKLLAATSVVDENAAWARFMGKVHAAAAEEEEQPVPRIMPLRRLGWMKIAAMVVMMAGAGWLIYILAVADRQLTIARSNNNIITATLSDGSVVVLNKHSSIEYPVEFATNTRKVKLTGEAFFKVAADKQRPFIITANNAAVTVVGTSFNVKTTQANTEVIVETGVVEVAGDQQSIKVLPHQKAVLQFGKKGPELTPNTDELYNYYRTKEFVCNGTPLSRLVEILNEAYNAHIVIADNEIKALPLTVTIKDAELSEVLKVVTSTLGITAVQTAHNVVLKK